MTGLDPAAGNIEVATLLTRRRWGLAIDYRTDTIEAVAGAGERFRHRAGARGRSEHVANVPAFIEALALGREARRPGPSLSTLNRTLRSFAAAIVGAEYVSALAARRHA